MPPPGYELFVRAICAHPEDDTGRLVYADWLDENGDPDRAEYIRLQVTHSACKGRKTPAHRRIDQLKTAFGQKWRAELPRVRGIDWRPFERGFVGSVSVRPTASIRAALKTVCEVAPVEDIVLCHCSPDIIRALVDVPELGQIRRIESRAGYADDASIARLAACERAAKLESLILPGSFWTFTAEGVRDRIPMITDRAAVALAESPHLSCLRRITLLTAHLSTQGLGVLRARFGDGFSCVGLIPAASGASL